MRIELDRTKCVGLGLCEAADPNHFEVGDDGKLIILDDTVTAGQRRSVDEAVRACPTSALRVVS